MRALPRKHVFVHSDLSRERVTGDAWLKRIGEKHNPIKKKHPVLCHKQVMSKILIEIRLEQNTSNFSGFYEMSTEIQYRNLTL